MNTGIMYALFGAAISLVGGGFGMIMGTLYAGQAGASLVSENKKAFGPALLMSALPSSQGIYGFLGAFLIMNKIAFLSGTPEMISNETGMALIAASLPIAFTALGSGAGQGKIIQAGFRIVAKDASRVGQAIILAVLIESMAVFGLLVTILMINGIIL